MSRANREVGSEGGPRPWRIVVVTVMGAAFVLFVRWNDTPQTPSEASKRTSSADARAIVELAKTDPEPVTWPSGWGRDPFARLHQPVMELPAPPPSPPKPVAVQPQPEAPPQLRVGGILYGQPPAVLINGVIYKEGDLVHGHRVQRIERERVVLECQGVSLVLTP